ncbi:hypothetical protein [Lysinibacillus endophyticus]|uniref:hypothetical protein n=1 Tax=Ureibacillus endophyticus TaxID=1978490 RepID=UPI0020A1A3E9|nr:hypothetical protein [Lysinibacillus endophyticus]MCP1143680.1 hypothetical protein [Lysinibacillus endophyticus]
MKKATKLLACAALTLPTIVAVAPVQEASAQSFTPTQTVYIVNGSNVALNFDYFTSAINAKVLTDLNIQYIQLSNGKYYQFSMFTSALNAFGSLNLATEALNNNNSYAQPLTNVIIGQVDVSTGKVITSQSSIDFEVIGID